MWGLELGNIRRHFALRCHEELQRYLGRIYEIWSKITLHDSAIQQFVDINTVRFLQGRVPRASASDRRAIVEHMGSNYLFPGMACQDTRQRIQNCLLSLNDIIPTLKTFHENVKLLEIGVRIIRDHIKPRRKSSLFQSLVDLWLPNEDCFIEITEGVFHKALLPAGLENQYLAYIQLFISAIRQSPNLGFTPPRRDVRSRAERAEVNTAYQVIFAKRAKLLGFHNEMIESRCGGVVSPLEDQQISIDSPISIEQRYRRPTGETQRQLQANLFIPSLIHKQTTERQEPTAMFVCQDFIKSFFRPGLVSEWIVREPAITLFISGNLVTRSSIPVSVIYEKKRAAIQSPNISDSDSTRRSEPNISLVSSPRFARSGTPSPAIHQITTNLKLAALREKSGELPDISEVGGLPRNSIDETSSEMSELEERQSNSKCRLPSQLSPHNRLETSPTVPATVDLSPENYEIYSNSVDELAIDLVNQPVELKTTERLHSGPVISFQSASLLSLRSTPSIEHVMNGTGDRSEFWETDTSESEISPGCESIITTVENTAPRLMQKRDLGKRLAMSPYLRSKWSAMDRGAGGILSGHQQSSFRRRSFLALVPQKEGAVNPPGYEGTGHEVVGFSKQHKRGRSFLVPASKTGGVEFSKRGRSFLAPASKAGRVGFSKQHKRGRSFLIPTSKKDRINSSPKEYQRPRERSFLVPTSKRDGVPSSRDYQWPRERERSFMIPTSKKDGSNSSKDYYRRPRERSFLGPVPRKEVRRNSMGKQDTNAVAGIDNRKVDLSAVLSGYHAVRSHLEPGKGIDSLKSRRLRKLEKRKGRIGMEAVEDSQIAIEGIKNSSPTRIYPTPRSAIDPSGTGSTATPVSALMNVEEKNKRVGTIIENEAPARSDVPSPKPTQFLEHNGMRTLAKSIMAMDMEKYLQKRRGWVGMVEEDGGLWSIRMDHILHFLQDGKLGERSLVFSRQPHAERLRESYTKKGRTFGDKESPGQGNSKRTRC